MTTSLSRNTMVDEDIMHRIAKKWSGGDGSMETNIYAALVEFHFELTSRRSIGMTSRQQDAYDFIRSYIDEHSMSPTFEEIKAGLGLGSKSGVTRIVYGLAERGLIRLLPKKARSIVVT